MRFKRWQRAASGLVLTMEEDGRICLFKLEPELALQMLQLDTATGNLDTWQINRLEKACALGRAREQSKPRVMLELSDFEE